MSKLLWIALGGGGGAVARYVVGGWAQRWSGASFPFGTMTVNVSGCLLIGLAMAKFGGPHLLRDELRLALVVGFLGGYTTFSTFGYETFMLANEGQPRWALGNMLLTNGLGLAAVWFGYRLGERWFGI